MATNNPGSFIRYASLLEFSRAHHYGEQTSTKEYMDNHPMFITTRVSGTHTLNSIYNKVTFNEKLAIMKENLCTKYFPFTYKYIALNEKPPITKENLHIFFFSL